MEPDELDKLIEGAKLGNVGAGDKGAAGLESLYGGSEKLYGGGAKGGSNQLAGVDLGPYKGALYNGPISTENVINVLAQAGRLLPAGLQRAPRPTGQLGQLGQMQLELQRPGAPRQLGPQLCRPAALRSLSGQRGQKRKRKSAKRCSCTH